MVIPTGLEPVSWQLSDVCFNQLNYGTTVSKFNLCLYFKTIQTKGLKVQKKKKKLNFKQPFIRNPKETYFFFIRCFYIYIINQILEKVNNF